VAEILKDLEIVAGRSSANPVTRTPRRAHAACAVRLRGEITAMARVDEEAAKRELEKAAAFNAQADELDTIAESLRSAARHHVHEAEQLRGIVRPPTNGN
jgi:hypothetical protein